MNAIPSACSRPNPQALTPKPTETMAVDQYGNTYHALGKHPRSELMKRLGCKHAERMYVDDLEGKSYHIGWIIAGHWLTIYHVSPMLGEK